MRKRCHRRPVPVRSLPITFGFTDQARTSASLMARTALTALLERRAVALDLAVLVRAAMYSNAVTEQMLQHGTVQADDGLADLIEAINEGAAAIQSMTARTHLLVNCSELECTQVTRLVEAFEALLSTATRREFEAATAFINQPTRIS